MQIYIEPAAGVAWDCDPDQINAANCHPPDHFERHRAFYDWAASHSIRDGDFIVIP